MSKELEVFAAYLAEKSEIKGKKAFQKLVYLAKCTGYPLMVDYRMHLYGPFSQEVAAELDSILARGVLNTCGDGISMTKTALSTSIIRENTKILSEYGGILEKLWALFGRKSPKELELIATAHFITQTLKEHYGITDRDKVIKQICKAKSPKFSLEEIESAYDEVKAIKELH